MTLSSISSRKLKKYTKGLLFSLVLLFSSSSWACGFVQSYSFCSGGGMNKICRGVCHGGNPSCEACGCNFTPCQTLSASNLNCGACNEL